MKIHAYAVKQAKASLEPYEYEAAALGPWDIEVAITHCGICHSDLSLIDNEWGISTYPLVPGHEIVGTITEIGENITDFAKNQRVGIGWQRSSCMHCEWCISGEENLCEKQEATCLGYPGGYADRIRVDSRFAFSIPEELDSAHASVLFCGGITVFSPLLHHGINPMSKVGVIGIGGLGHLALQCAKGFGCEVTAFSSTESKREEALSLGAHHFIATNDKNALKPYINSFDFILSTVPTPQNWEEYIALLRPHGTLCFVGAQTKPIEVPFFSIISGRKCITASNIGSRTDIHKMLTFAVEHKIHPDIEIFSMQDVNAAIEKVRRGKIRYRAVLENRK